MPRIRALTVRLRTRLRALTVRLRTRLLRAPGPVRRPCAPAAAVAALALALSLAVGSGCATTSPGRQDWALLDTPHYRILSSIGEESTRALAAQLEAFRAGVAYLAGGTLAEPARRTRVFAFDDRTFSRPFDVRSTSGYFLPAPDGGFLVLRQGGDFRKDATVALRHLHAHALLRTGEGLSLPIWYEEGIAQVASTIDAEATRARVGGPHAGHVNALQSWSWVPIGSVLGAFTLDEFGSRSREMYESQTWAFFHYVRFGQPRAGQADAQLALLRERGTGEETLEQAFGTSVKSLDHALAGYGRLEQWKQVELRITLASDRPVVPVPVPRATATEELARLALALHRPSVARDYLERALAVEADSARALAGLATLAAEDGRLEEADAGLARALALAPDDPVVQQDAGERHLAEAQRAANAARRSEALARARRHFTRSAELDPSRSEPLLRLGATYLLDAEPVATGLAYARRAAELDPASLDATLLTAQLFERQGRRENARRLAAQVETRSHERELQEAAAAILDRLGRRTILE